MTDESTPHAPRNRRTLRLLATGGATAALLAAGSVAAFAAAGTGTPTPKPNGHRVPGPAGPGNRGTSVAAGTQAAHGRNGDCGVRQHHHDHRPGRLQP